MMQICFTPKKTETEKLNHLPKVTELRNDWSPVRFHLPPKDRPVPATAYGNRGYFPCRRADLGKLNSNKEKVLRGKVSRLSLGISRRWV